MLDALLEACRDKNPEARAAASQGISFFAFDLELKDSSVPKLQAIVAGMAEALGDPSPAVRKQAAMALSSLYFTPSKPKPEPLPESPGFLVEALCRALKDHDSEVRKQVLWVIDSIAKRLDGPPPPALIVALESTDPSTRADAARTVGSFPKGDDTISLKLFQMLEQDESPEVRGQCDGALIFAKLSSAAVPALIQLLHSPDRRVRFRAADRLSLIVPRPVEALPSILPFLDEQFQPQTPSEQKHPEWNDPAVAAIWALGAIAPGTPIAPRAVARLNRFLDDRKHPWRAEQAREALQRIRGSDSPVGSPSAIPPVD